MVQQATAYAHAAPAKEPVVAEVAPFKEEPIPEEDEQEVPVSEVRTVVRTERHVHDTENGPMVEER